MVFVGLLMLDTNESVVVVVVVDCFCSLFRWTFHSSLSLQQQQEVNCSVILSVKGRCRECELTCSCLWQRHCVRAYSSKSFSFEYKDKDKKMMSRRNLRQHIRTKKDQIVEKKSVCFQNWVRERQNVKNYVNIVYCIVMWWCDAPTRRNRRWYSSLFWREIFLVKVLPSLSKERERERLTIGWCL